MTRRLRRALKTHHARLPGDRPPRCPYRLRAAPGQVYVNDLHHHRRPNLTVMPGAVLLRIAKLVFHRTKDSGKEHIFETITVPSLPSLIHADWFDVIYQDMVLLPLMMSLRLRLRPSCLTNFDISIELLTLFIKHSFSRSDFFCLTRDLI